MPDFHNPSRDEQQADRAPLALGDRLAAWPCEVVVTDVPSKGMATGWCGPHLRPHLLDARLFNQGRGPWRRR